MKQISKVEILGHLRLFLTFADGTHGELDFSQEPRTGVFSAWEDPALFSQVAIGDRGRTLVWPGEIDLCADSLWLEITRQPPESIYPGLHAPSSHA
jgi:hypothetical protein